ncbi:uncharacterized protein LTR77_010730 [Saxophila tyrrhenica]|uniref:Glucanase n=1 Tax=Saxophila tyrrhenica TaxID=1690608 RepID=A0AAV9NUY9_9PEZI|nr:hypothetical protein LTR77_010730 [Saxophila tyrrhenica]
MASMQRSLALTALAFGAGAWAQQAGTSTAENHPSMPWDLCTASGCTEQKGSIVLDSNWRWVHNVDGYTNCYDGNTWNADYCPNNQACAENCALDGADYTGTYGIQASDGSLTLTLKPGSNVGSRVYLMATDDENYEMFKLKNKEFTVDVDVSNLPCGLNGALYFVSMAEDGDLSATNKAGAKYGTGYCDSQCPQDIKFIDGKANVDGWTPSDGDPNSGTGNIGACCAEMDIWEANSISAAYTPHPCDGNGLVECTSDAECGVGDNRYKGTCDRDGCDFNSFRLGNESFYGPGDIVDTGSKMTVVTQFITSDNTDTGDLTAIRRVYVQGGKVIANSQSDVAGIDKTNEITSAFCTQQKDVFGDTNSFADKGGLAKMGDAMADGMVLVLSIWDDYTAGMRWLDAEAYPADADPSKPGIARGTCAVDSGVPSEVESQFGDASVTFSNIKFGAIGSTYSS